MGGVISVLIAIFAIVAFMASGNLVMSVFAFLTAFVATASGLHMRHFSRILARQRLYVEALQRGEFKDGSPEVERYWREMPLLWLRTGRCLPARPGKTAILTVTNE